ncbi:NTP pyrophosphohydrolase [Streptomyces sp. BI20]|uniref:NTP pyrophosphohydrolase n=1 Tax=Streptomyces sp. BI20 TaxID=3403460 RepID=UPI003C78D97D
MTRPVMIVDGANVVGSTPDGWWRDRKGAAERLRDRLAARAAEAEAEAEEIVLVVEGAARDVTPVPGVRVESAPGSGDDAIVALVAALAPRPCRVVTADRELRARVTALGASTVGPGLLRPPAH